MATQLQKQLGLCPVVIDPGDVGIVANHDWTLKRAHTNYPLADWFIAIEDDADPVDDFYTQADKALASCPAPVASLYFGYVGQRRRATNLMLGMRDPHWIMCRGFTSAVCIAVHKSLIHAFLHTAADITNMTVDQRYSAAVRHCAKDLWVPHSNPSLVDHLDGDGVDGHPGVKIERKAYQTGTRDEWTGKHQKLHHRVWGY